MIAQPYKLIVFLFIITQVGFSQSSHTLPGLIAQASANYPSIRSKQAQIALGNALVTDARNAWIPSVRLGEQVTAGSDNGLSGPYFSLGFVPSVSGGRRAENRSELAVGNLAAVVAEWEIYNFGSYEAATNEALAGLKVGEADLERERYEVRWAVVRQYFEWLKFEQLLAVQRKNIERAQHIKLVVKSFADSGLKAGVDTSFAEAELSKLRINVLDLENGQALVRNRLTLLTGLDVNAITPDTIVLKALPTLLALASGQSNVAQHPDLRHQQAMYEQDIARLEAVRKRFMPKVMLMGAGMLRGSSISPSDVYDENLLTGLKYTRSNYIVGAAITYNLTDPIRAGYKTEIQQSRAEVTRQGMEERKLLVNNAVQQANLQLQNANAHLREIPFQSKAAADAYSQKLALYNSGLTNIVELTTALYLVNRAETDSILANDMAWKAIIEKLYASNQLDLFLSNLPK